MSSIIEITDFSWRYINSEVHAVQNINLKIEEGKFVGVIGQNGAGKTSLAYAMDGLIPGQYHGIKKGLVKVDGIEVEAYHKGVLQKIVGMVFSDPEAQFTAMTVEDELVFGMENLGMSIPEIKERLDWVCDLTDMTPLLAKPPYEISGGQKQRVALAAVLAMTPRVLILDEPTSMLDPFSRKRVFDVLGKLKREQKMTVIVIEHSLENLIPLADEMILMSEGKLVLHEETHTFFQEMDFLLANGVYPPETPLFFHYLKKKGHYNGPIPVTNEEALAQLKCKGRN
ncbi:MAG: energy-coupling factor ABC transporter ATP-binding protein [Anaerolinea sp.]|nr:energy-coupling factor ABC transporter ATP-binding protein [Anaerolinea sp.]